MKSLIAIGAVLLSSTAHAQPSRLIAEARAFSASARVTPRDAAEAAARCDQGSALAARIRAAIEARRGPATMADDFRLYDAFRDVVDSTTLEGTALAYTAVDKALRDAGESCQLRLSAQLIDARLSRPLYDRIAAIPAASLAPDERYMMAHVLREFRLTGVDQDQAKRVEIAAAIKRQDEIGQKFDRNINEDATRVSFDADALLGLPEDFLAAHKPGADGKIMLSIDYPDWRPVMQFAERYDTRAKMNLAFLNRAYPINQPVMEQLFESRAKMAQLLGYSSFAAFDLADKMAGSPERVQRLLDEVNGAARPVAQRELEMLSERYRRIDPSATVLDLNSQAFVTRIFRKERYDVDAAEIRRYFTRDGVRAGIFRLVHDLFGSDIRPWQAPVWAPDVSAWSLYDGDRLIGHFYLDLSPRAGKYNHAAMFPIRVGGGGETPINMLVTNFPAKGPMDHGDVLTFLHEFGHLIHFLYAGHHRYELQGFGALEPDFIEAPSQMLENWAWDYDTLKTFAVDEQGRTIPRDLVDRMNVSRRFGLGLRWTQQLGDAAASLGMFTRPPGFPIEATYRELEGTYGLIPEPPGSHWYASFGHLTGYGASYYTYVWSQAIAFDLLSRFRKAGLRDPATALAYRRQILEATGTRPSGELIQAFLGREWTTDAFKREFIMP